jgi:hypothetical protein
MKPTTTSRAARFLAAMRAAGDLGPSPAEREIARVMAYRLETPMRAVPLFRTGYVEPTWLSAIASFWERALAAHLGHGPPVFMTFSGPTQTGKSVMSEVGAAWMLAHAPAAFIASVSYGSALTLPRSRRIRDDVRDLGVSLRDDSAAVEQWTTTAGGGLLATGIGGPVTGQPGLAAILIEDPYKDEQEARSAAVRRDLEAFLDGVVLTRLGARTSVAVSFSRWDVADLIGYIRSRKLARWEHHTVPALDEHGEPVARIPGKDRAFYENLRADMPADKWAALMMGEPRPREGRLFRGAPPTYSAPSQSHQCVRIGVDFAYSKRTSADHNAAVVVGKTDRAYEVLRVVRRQCDAVQWAAELAELKRLHPSASFHAYIGGTELGTIDMLRDRGIRVDAQTSRADKYARAQGTAASWNGNEADVADAMAKRAMGQAVIVPELVPRRIYLPAVAAWDVAGFVERTLDFSGIDGGVDDEQDALVAAVDACGPIIVDHAPIQQPGRLDRRIW